MGSGKGGATQLTPEGQYYLEMYPEIADSGMSPEEHYQRYGQAEGRYWGTPESDFGFIMPSFDFEMPESNYDPEQAKKDYSDALQQQAESQARSQGLRDRDTLYSGYLDAADTSTNYVNAQIADEQSNARLLGIDYAITDEQKSQRISDYFASVWGAGEQSQLEGLISQWGAPQGFSGFALKRGDGSKYAGAKEGKTETVSTSQGQKPILLEDEEDDVLGGKGKTILGA